MLEPTYYVSVHAIMICMQAKQSLSYRPHVLDDRLSELALLVNCQMTDIAIDTT